MAMFSGIIETTAPILQTRNLNQSLELVVQRPIFFDDLKVGDSIAVNGICLTLEAFDTEKMFFTLGHETLKILGEGLSLWLSSVVNLERSLAFGSRVHGHFVSGHVDVMVTVKKSEALGDNWLLSVEVPEEFAKFCWKKGSVTLHGVSLTINDISGGSSPWVEVCLIPETQKRTNLTHIRPGELLGFEVDSFAKAVAQAVSQLMPTLGGKNV